MDGKLKKDFRERHKASLEREMLKDETSSIPEESKLKHSDDYRGKIVHDKERFQDKVHEKISKVSSDNEKIEGTSKRNAKYRASDKGSVNEAGKADYDTEVKNGKIYDSLGQDLDNDGIIDRYDNDFRDSDYFESTYDVDDNLHKKDEFIGSSSKNHKAQKSMYKKKNYSESLYTRKKDDVPKENKSEGNKAGKDAVSEKENISLSKDQKKKLKKDMVKVSALSGLAKGSETVRDYLSHGSDENKGVEAGEKTADASSKLIHGIKRYSDKKRAKKGYDLTNKDYKIRKRKSKLEFRDAKEELKKTDEYKRASVYKRFQKKNQVKAAISRENKSRLRDRIKEGLIGTLKGSKDMIIRKAKGLMLIFIGIIILGTFVINFAGTSMTGFMNSTSSVLTTSYLSKPNVLSEINQKFSAMESELQSEVDHVEENYPGYDEYILNNTEYIGHNVHELLSYITSRCGEVKNVSEVESILKELFESMYDLEYREEIEIRYRTVTETYTDEDGNEYTESHEEPYEYKKLIVTLHKKEMDSIIRQVFANYPDNLKHYEALFLAQGNMGEAFGNTDLISSNGGVGGGKEYEASSEVQKKIVNAAYITPSPGAGWCAMWVSQVYQNAGLGYIGGNANDMYRNYTFTSDRSKLKVGMLVAVESSSSGSTAGLTYGHVGIYIGDGKVIDNIGYIRVTTLDDWIATFCKHHPVGFGFPPNVNR
ncbi:TPA: CHAP domain-containing protein [Streptococcus equi subsp. zooepidemicus]|uniref:CHAP domain-containing protein n=1 Tax=Streptococcus equi TaxID=1336 RepID=UPI000DA2C504|nr:CHAP domain-containing protein [Streptococcus equi]MCD3381397.1 CHAP domain-containing protein [Streptococcus equi subsp. zooepidemicus]MCD3416651.1 CHAP domain-containing protein [Streptococcus equi subsp. zooepidemicus]MCD3429051.1 CHAP domain-containing protein [Streptococcus equi subsp. zooepidemicus]MCD3459463.1 CHAP domain-containing protein [Streptococcus equi subsp. zooepidemicus]MCD3462076.1 CHAP domain-containing protein [Streptococcus equi subsp. zooepidemicus]